MERVYAQGAALVPLLCSRYISSGMGEKARSARLLVVEDDSSISESLCEMLALLGHQVVGAADTGEGAIEMAKARHPQLVLADIRLRGDMDGIEAARRLRETLDLPTVFLTAHADASTLDRMGQAEPFGFVMKPFDLPEIHAAVSVALHRRDAETKLRDMEAWLSTTLSSIGDAVVATNAEGRITFINVTAEGLTGWTRTDVLGRSVSDVLAIHQAGSADPVPRLFSQPLHSGEISRLTEDYELRTKSWERVPIDGSVAPIRGPRGDIEGVVVVFRDRSEAKRVAQARLELEQRAREAQHLESLGLMAGGIAHDFNNLLAVIMGNATLELENAQAGSELAESLNTIVATARRAAGLCTQMLAYAGKGRSARLALDLGAFVEEAVQLLRISIPKTIALTVDVEKGDGNLVVADASQMQQVIMNLVINAADALGTTPGAVTIRVAREEVGAEELASAQVGHQLPPGPYVVLEVTDTGPGMPREVMPRIFDPFFTTKRAGRGLGLSAVLGMLRSHEAGLVLESEPGAGTRFRIFLAPAPARARPSEPLAPSEEAGSWSSEGDVLLVEDEEAVRKVAASALARLGFSVVEARDGAEGLERFTAEPDRFCAVVSDVTMPRLDGIQASLRMRKLRPDVPIVLMSGYTADSSTELLAQRDVKFLEKPFSVRKLRDALRKLVLARRKAPPA